MARLTVSVRSPRPSCLSWQLSYCCWRCHLEVLTPEGSPRHPVSNRSHSQTLVKLNSPPSYLLSQRLLRSNQRPWRCHPLHTMTLKRCRGNSKAQKTEKYRIYQSGSCNSVCQINRSSPHRRRRRRYSNPQAHSKEKKGSYFCKDSRSYKKRIRLFSS